MSWSLLNENGKIKLSFASGMDYGNFGDLLSRYIVEKLSGLQVEKYYRNDASGHLCAIGSILSKNAVVSPATIWGAGFLSPQATYKIKLTAIRQFFRGRYGKPNILATRGKLSQEILRKAGFVSPDNYGDPGLLMPLIYTKDCNKPKTYSVVVALHRRHDSLKPLFDNIEGVKVVDINVNYNEIEAFVDKILDCDVVLSSSLHGLIIANAYGKPCVRLKVEDMPIHTKVEREDFKFEDYLSGLNACKVECAANDYRFSEMCLKHDCKLQNDFIYSVITKGTVPEFKINLGKLITAFPFELCADYKNIDYIV